MLHALTMPGGFVAVILYAVTAFPSSWKAKYVPWLVWYVTADVPLSVVPETFAWATGARNPAKIVPIQKVRVAIFAERKHKLRRRGARHIDHCPADTAKIGVAIVET